MLSLAILGLAGCAIALIAVALDWRQKRVFTLDFGDKPITTTWTSRGAVVHRQRETDEVTNT